MTTPAPSTLSPRAELAILGRSLHREGYDDHHFGHITLSQPDGTFFTLPRELSWDEPQAADVLHIDAHGSLIDGEWTVPPSIELHLAYHRANPDTAVLLHHHPHFATIWAATGRLPSAYDQTSAFLDDSEIVLHAEYGGNVSDPEAARLAAEGMGAASVVLLAHHGVMVRGDDVAHAHARAVAIEWRARRAWEVESLGNAEPMSRRGRQRITAALREQCDGRPPLLWDWAVRREVRKDPAVLNERTDTRDIQ